MLEVVNDILPQNKPRYLMGTPWNILDGIERGVDMFDCVMPTRNGRNGMIFQMLHETKEAIPGEIGHTLIQKQFLSHIRSNDSYFEMLPADFTKQDAVKQAEVLGIGLKSLDRWLAKFVQSSDLQHVSHGIYRKSTHQIA